MKTITWLLDSLNNNYGNFCLIWSISSQDNVLSVWHHLFHIVLIKLCCQEQTSLKKYQKKSYLSSLPHQTS